MWALWLTSLLPILTQSHHRLFPLNFPLNFPCSITLSSLHFFLNLFSTSQFHFLRQVRDFWVFFHQVRDFWCFSNFTAKCVISFTSLHFFSSPSPWLSSGKLFSWGKSTFYIRNTRIFVWLYVEFYFPPRFSMFFYTLLTYFTSLLTSLSLLFSHIFTAIYDAFFFSPLDFQTFLIASEMLKLCSYFSSSTFKLLQLQVSEGSLKLAILLSTLLIAILLSKFLSSWIFQ